MSFFLEIGSFSLKRYTIRFFLQNSVTFNEACRWKIFRKWWDEDVILRKDTTHKKEMSFLSCRFIQQTIVKAWLQTNQSFFLTKLRNDVLYGWTLALTDEKNANAFHDIGICKTILFAKLAYCLVGHFKFFNITLLNSTYGRLQDINVFNLGK